MTVSTCAQGLASGIIPIDGSSFARFTFVPTFIMITNPLARSIALAALAALLAQVEVVWVVLVGAAISAMVF